MQFNSSSKLNSDKKMSRTVIMSDAKQPTYTGVLPEY